MAFAHPPRPPRGVARRAAVDVGAIRRSRQARHLRKDEERQHRILEPVPLRKQDVRKQLPPERLAPRTAVDSASVRPVLGHDAVQQQPRPRARFPRAGRHLRARALRRRHQRLNVVFRHRVVRVHKRHIPPAGDAQARVPRAGRAAARLKAHLPVRMCTGTPAQQLRRAVPGAVVHKHRLKAVARPLRRKRGQQRGQRRPGIAAGDDHRQVHRGCLCLKHGPVRHADACGARMHAGEHRPGLRSIVSHRLKPPSAARAAPAPSRPRTPAAATAAPEESGSARSGRAPAGRPAPPRRRVQGARSKAP